MAWKLLVMWIILWGLGGLRVAEAGCPGPGFDDSKPEEWAEEPLITALGMHDLPLLFGQGSDDEDATDCWPCGFEDSELEEWVEEPIALDPMASLECAPCVPFILAEGFGGAKPGYVLDDGLDFTTVVAEGPGDPWPAYLDRLLLCSMCFA